MQQQFLREAKDGVHSIYKIANDTYRLDEKGIVNAYLLIGTKEALLIDTGNGLGNISETVKELTDKDLNVVLTHRHGDHDGGSHQFQDVFCGRRDKKIVYDLLSCKISRQIILACNKKNTKDRSHLHFTHGKYNPQYHFISVGNGFDLGNRMVEVICTPGHTYGSIVYTDDKEGLMFTGDDVNPYMFLQLPGATSLSLWLRGAKRILALSEYYQAYMGHGDGLLTKETIASIVKMGEELLAKGKKPFGMKQQIIYPPMASKEDLNPHIFITKGRIR